MNGADSQGPDSPYYNVAQLQPPPQGQTKRKGDEESPSGGQRVSVTVIVLCTNTIVLPD